MKLSWLDSYARINALAMKKALKKFSKNFFTTKENHIVNTLEDEIEKLDVCVSEKASEERLKFRVTFGNQFFNGDKHKARLCLERQLSKPSIKDVISISFMQGIIAALAIILIYFLAVPDNSNDYHLSEI